MKTNDMRFDFSKGTVGQGLRVRPDTKAFDSGLRNSQNMMVQADGSVRRRWGTWDRDPLPGATRLEMWDFAEGTETQFILMFSAGLLEIKTADLTDPGGNPAAFNTQPWTDDTIWFLSVTYEREKLIIADESFRTKVVTYDSENQTFSMDDFSFDTVDKAEDRPLAAPFYEFEEDIQFSLTCFTTKENEGYGTYIASAFGIDESEFDLSAGTGTIRILGSPDFTLTGRAGQHLRLGGGEIKLTTILGPATAEYKVITDIAYKMDVDPVWTRKNSQMVELAHFDHGLKPDDLAFFYGVPVADGDTERTQSYLERAPRVASDSTTVHPPENGTGGAPYTVEKVTDADHFEVLGDDTSDSGWGLMGGSDMRMIVTDENGEMKGIKEPVFSPQRGWPTTGCLHESRLWLGGSDLLPDAIYGSKFGQYRNFDMGEGDPSDAVTLLSIGEQARVRHLLSEFDLLILTDKAEFYVPGSADRAITQETARVVNATEHGSSYTTPVLFDGGTFFIDKVGRNVREMKIETRDEAYTASPVSLVVPDWIDQPKHSAHFRGAVHNNTPYLFWSNLPDGSAIVMHANRNEDFFGFMRWTLNEGSFVSFVSLSSRLYACVQRKSTGGYYLLEFDTLSDDPVTTDFSFYLKITPATDTFPFPNASGRDGTQIEGKAKDLTTFNVYSSGVFNEVTGDVVLPEDATEVRIGDPMTTWADIGPPTAQAGTTNKMGDMICLVKAEVHWLRTQTGYVEGEDVVIGIDQELFADRAVVDEWRPYWVSLWDREPVLRLQASEPGHFGMRALNLTTKF